MKKPVELLVPFGGGVQIPTDIIVHAMAEYILDESGKPIHASAFLAGRKLSEHLLITPDAIPLRCREDNLMAWHAKKYNKNSLGIAFLVKGEHDYESFKRAMAGIYLTNKQFDEGIDQVRSWQEIWDIKSVRRHSDVSPERKVDPGFGFPWDEFKSRVQI